MEKAKSTFIFWQNRCWNCKKENCNKNRCDVPIDEARCERNRLEWMKENKKPPTSSPRRGNDRRSGKSKPFAWRVPEPAENNKRTIYGRPHTWNGKNSWTEDNTPASGLPDTPPPGGTNLADVPSQVQPPPSNDDATALTTATTLTQEQKNELRRVSANLNNFGASLATMKDFMSTLTQE